MLPLSASLLGDEVLDRKASIVRTITAQRPTVQLRGLHLVYFDLRTSDVRRQILTSLLGPRAGPRPQENPGLAAPR